MRSHRYTMVDGLKTGGFQLICFENDKEVFTSVYDTSNEAHNIGTKFLMRELNFGELNETATS